MACDLESERKAEPTLPGFIAWLESKDPNEKYNWPNSEKCACGQYARSLGVEDWRSDDKWSKFNMLARGKPVFCDSEREEWTFGKCLDRAKKAGSKEPV
jgi:hypothetical protein